MHHHEHDHVDDDPQTTTRRREAPEPWLGAAAAAGRPDVLGTSGMLGLQRSAGNAAAAGLLDEERSPVLDVISSGGQPLSGPLRAEMEGRMGHDFGDVRVHTGDAADASARSVRAHAYTTGSNIVFQRGAWDPDSASGQTLLAHELTHVVQQRTGPVDGTPTGTGVRVSDPSDRFEQEAAATAEQVMSRTGPDLTAQGGSPTPGGAGFLQREATEEEEEEVQASAVQREAVEEEEEAQA